MALRGLLLRFLGVACVVAGMAGAAPAALAESTAVAVARASLAAAERAESEARAQLSEEQAAGRLSARALEDFQAWVERLARDVEYQRELLAWLQAQETGAAVGRAPGADAPFRYAPAPTRAEHVSALDRQLDASLGEFDEMLLREQRLLSERPRRSESSAASGGSAGGGAGAAASAAGAEGTEGAAGASGSWAEGAGAERGAEAAAAAEAGAAGGRAEAEAAAQAGATGGTLGAESTETGRAAPVDTAAADQADQDRGRGTVRGAPPDIPDGRDDDIVARQIREAAERETDPALQRKLWDEYRRYKNANANR